MALGLGRSQPGFQPIPGSPDTWSLAHHMLLFIHQTLIFGFSGALGKSDGGSSAGYCENAGALSDHRCLENLDGRQT